MNSLGLKTLVVQTISAKVVAFTISMVIAWRLAIVMIAVQPLIVMCFYARHVLLQNMSQKATKAEDESSKLTVEAITNLRTVIAFSSQERILQMLEKAQESPRHESIRQSWFTGIGLALSQSLSTASWALDFWYVRKLMAEGYFLAKALIETYMILASTGHVIAISGSMTTDLAKGSESVGSVFVVLECYTRIEPKDSEGYQLEKITSHVEIRDMYFSYPAWPDVIIFQGFSINVEAGKSTALVG
ncbi:hypothetical protein SO802_001257 [Lithocarpus litseifolius]|uniref:ABC transmembrane type-1 domain-containing protein n=1 Tax=Lithocarpus litseifolius TaxID=425828 RepID=A0AAW2DXC7_9ROSI